MKFRLLLFSILFTTGLLSSCKRNKPTHVIKGVYYWRTQIDVSDYEKQFLDTNKIQKLYLKILDIDWNEVNHAYPVSITDGYYYYLRNLDVIPCVFITNNTMIKIDTSEIQLLAMHIVSKAGEYNYNELQLDCDWTEKTNAKYFALIKEVKEFIAPKTLSVTIRLHQYKYRERNGIPPADKGVLMLYNIGGVKVHSDKNSIFDSAEAEKYLDGADSYPLHLDMALPCFSWGVAFQNKQFKCLLNNFNNEAALQLKFLSQKQNGFFEVIADTVYRDIYFRNGDEIKVEAINDNLLQQANELARKAVNSDTTSIVLFDLDEHDLKNINHHTYEKVYKSTD